MAYWINAYNAYTIRLIVDHYPVQSIKDIGSKIKIPFVTTPWASKFFSIGGEQMSLDNIEHGILRKKFDDPRIHFTLVCASISCPRLRNIGLHRRPTGKAARRPGPRFSKQPGQEQD